MSYLGKDETGCGILLHNIHPPSLFIYVLTFSKYRKKFQSVIKRRSQSEDRRKKEHR